MNNSKLKLFLGLALIVAASGCTDTSGSSSSEVSISQTKGLAIDQFAAFPAEVPDNTQVQLDIVLVNKGGATARNVRWKVENIPFEGSRSWSRESGFKRNSLRISPANPETGQTAGRRSLHPTMIAPNLPAGISIPYEINLNVTYDYETSGVTKVTLMSRSVYQEQGASKSSVSLDNTGGPVQLKTNTRNPIVYYSSGSGTSVQNSRFCVTATNSGNGDIVGEEVDVTVETSGTLKVATERDSNSYGSSASGTIEFIGGRSSSQKCFYLEAPNSVSGQLTLPITVTSDYRYQLEDSTSVTVNGRETTGSGTSGGTGSSNTDVSWSWSYESWASSKSNAQIDSFWNTASGTGGVAPLVSNGYLTSSEASSREPGPICSAFYQARQDGVSFDTSYYNALGCNRG